MKLFSTMRRRSARGFTLTFALVFALASCTSHPASNRSEARMTSPKTGVSTAGSAGIPTQRVYFRGVGVTVPAWWPVIDGAHGYTSTCSSAFSGQSDRVLIGESYQAEPRCPVRVGPYPKADGVWIRVEDGSHASDALRTTLAGHQDAYVAVRAQTQVVQVWFHGLYIEIGIGSDASIEEAILNSIDYDAAARNTGVRGRCPPLGPISPRMPLAVRVKSPLTFEHGQAQLTPEPAAVTPRITAAEAWRSYTSSWALRNPIVWHLYFGGFSSLTPATINPDGSTTPQNRGGPAWVIFGTGVSTIEGPCGPTVLAAFDANDGHDLGVSFSG